MKDVYAGSLDTAAYSAVLAGSSWVYDDIGKITQEQLSANMSAIATSLTIGSGHISVSGRRVFDNSLRFSILSDATIITGGSSGGNVNVYTDFGSLQYNTTSGFTSLGVTGGEGNYISPTGAVTPDTEETTYSGLNYTSTSRRYLMDTSLGVGAKTYSPPTKFSYSRVLTHTEESNVWFSGTSAFPPYDPADPVQTNIVITVETVFGYTRNAFSQTWPFSNIRELPINSSSGESALLMSFPYPVGGKPYFTLAELDYYQSGSTITDSSTYSLKTPHETLDTDVNTTVEGKWNLHDGGVLIQCVDIDRELTEDIERVIYVNGVRATSIAGIAANEIEAAFLNIPLSKIRAFT